MVPAGGGVPVRGVYLPREVYLPGGVPATEGVPARGLGICQGGVPALGVPTWGVYLPGGVPAWEVTARGCTCQGGVPAQGGWCIPACNEAGTPPPPMNRMTDRQV